MADAGETDSGADESGFGGGLGTGGEGGIDAAGSGEGFGFEGSSSLSDFGGNDGADTDSFGNGGGSPSTTGVPVQTVEATRREDQALPFDVQGLFSGATLDAEGNLQLSLDPQLQEAARGLFTQAEGLTGNRFLQELQSMDSAGVRRGIFGELEALQAPGRERARTNLEARLLSQGRLGSGSFDPQGNIRGGGAFDQFALEQSIGQQSQANSLQAFQQAMQQQQNLFGLGTGLFQAGLQGQGQALNIGNAGLPLAQLGLGTTMREGAQAPQGPNPALSLLGAGVGAFFGGPGGATLGANIGGQF